MKIFKLIGIVFILQTALNGKNVQNDIKLRTSFLKPTLECQAKMLKQNRLYDENLKIFIDSVIKKIQWDESFFIKSVNDTIIVKNFDKAKDIIQSAKKKIDEKSTDRYNSYSKLLNNLFFIDSVYSGYREHRDRINYFYRVVGFSGMIEKEFKDTLDSYFLALESVNDFKFVESGETTLAYINENWTNRNPIFVCTHFDIWKSLFNAAVACQKIIRDNEDLSLQYDNFLKSSSVLIELNITLHLIDKKQCEIKQAQSHAYTMLDSLEGLLLQNTYWLKDSSNLSFISSTLTDIVSMKEVFKNELYKKNKNIAVKLQQLTTEIEKREIEVGNLKKQKE